MSSRSKLNKERVLNFEDDLMKKREREYQFKGALMLLLLLLLFSFILQILEPQLWWQYKNPAQAAATSLSQYFLSRSLFPLSFLKKY